MTTDQSRKSSGHAKTPLESRPTDYSASNDWRPDGWPGNPVNLSVADRPILGEKLAALAQQVSPESPNHAAKQILTKAQDFGLNGSKQILHRFFALERDPRKKKPGKKNESGHEAKDEWSAKTVDYQAVAKSAFCLLHKVGKAEGPKWDRFEEQVFEGTSLLPPGRDQKTLTNHQIVQGLFERLRDVVFNTGIDVLWGRLADTPFEISFSYEIEDRDEELDTPIQNRPNLSDEQVEALELGKLVRVDPLSLQWEVGDVDPDADLSWSEVSIELGRIAVPKDLWVLEIPRNLRDQFTVDAANSVPLHGFEDEEDAGGETISRFPPEAQKWLLQEGWGGQVPDNQWDVEAWAADDASNWIQKTLYFDCRVMLTVARDTEGHVQISLELRPRRMDDGRGLLDASFATRDDLIKRLKGEEVALTFDMHRMNESYWPEIIYADGKSKLPASWAAVELEISAEDVGNTFVLDQLRLADANEHLSSNAFHPTIAVAAAGGSRQFAEGTVLNALFANLALGDCPERIDRLLEAQAQSIRDFGNAHLDELAAESDALLAELDKAIGGQS